MTQPAGGYTGSDMGFQGAPRAGRLGLGLGLNPMQRGSFLAAANAGQGADYIGSHPMLENRIENRIQPGSDRETALQGMIAGQGAPSGATVRYGRQPPMGGGGGGMSPLGPTMGPPIDRGMTPEQAGGGDILRPDGIRPDGTPTAMRSADLGTAAEGMKQAAMARQMMQRQAMGRGQAGGGGMAGGAALGAAGGAMGRMRMRHPGRMMARGGGRGRM